jgi:hypothetical protein
MSFGNISSVNHKVFLKAQPVKDAFNYPHTMFRYSSKTKAPPINILNLGFRITFLKFLSHNFVSLKSIFLFEKVIVIRVFMNFADYYESRVSILATKYSVIIFYNVFKSDQI